MPLKQKPQDKPILFVFDVQHHPQDKPFERLPLFQDIVAQGFQVQSFSRFEALLAQFKDKAWQHNTRRPAGVLLWLGAESPLRQDDPVWQQMRALKAAQPSEMPWVVLSEQQDMTTQIAAFQAGASHYLTYANDNPDLVQKLLQMTGCRQQNPYRVVMVDDCSIVLTIQTELLRASGIEVWASENPMDLFSLLTTVKPDVLVLDLHMPQACGAQVAWAVRQAQSEAELPIVFVSGEDDLAHQMLALKQGGDDFLVKPVNPKQFIETVKMRAERARQHNRVQAELKHKLYEQSREHQALNHHAIVSVADRAGRIVEVNDKFCQISGFTREELIGQNHRIVKSPRHPPGFYQDLWRTIVAGEVWQGEICNLGKQGQEYWVKSTITPFLDEEGQIYQYVSIRTDITQIKQLELEHEKRIFEQSERVKEWRCLNQIMALLANDAVEDHDLLNQVVNAIPQGWRHPSDTCALIDLNGINYATPGFQETHWCQYSAIELEQFSGQLIVCRLQPDESEFDDGYGVLLAEEQRLLDNIGMQIGQAFKRREAKRATQFAREEAERANRAKSDFLSSMSHELRTPLNSIIGFSQLLELSALSEKQKKQVHTIGSSGKHLLSLINDVLEFAKLESGKLSLNIESVEVLPIIEQVLALSESHAYAQNIQLELVPCEQAFFIYADPLRFKQVVLNLMSNSIKYNRPQGKVFISWQICEREQQRFWQLNVKDTGVGIAQQDLGRLFEPFDRLGHEGSNIEGTGIGLSITKDLVEQMGGWIDVESELDVGTTFSVNLPLDKQATHSITMHTSAADSLDTEREHIAGVKNLKVLYVEDNAANMKLMAEVAQLISGIEFRIAPTAENGLQQAQAWLPQLILLDINLPGMNGDEAITHFRALPGYQAQQPSIFAVTANVLADQVAHYQQLGFDEIIAKPFELAQVVQQIQAIRDGL